MQNNNFKVRFLHSHPIQYHSPLFQTFSSRENVDFKVYYCSDYGLSKSGKRYHPEFGELPNWDTKIVDGYQFEILKNNSPLNSIFKGFWGLMNFGIFNRLRKDRPDILVINGWNYFSYVFAAICCKVLGIKVAVRGDNTLEHEHRLSGLKKKIKQLLYGGFLFKLYDHVGYVGERNKIFFKAYKVPERKMVWLPHCVNNQFFRAFYLENIDKRQSIKEEIGFTEGFHLLFVGRLHWMKRIFDIIDALKKLKEKINIVYVGGGDLKGELENYCQNHGFKNYTITGFLNQSELLKYYLAGDALVLPSSGSETWGLVVNEAMNFDKPVIVSDKVGCGLNLCTKENGFIFSEGDTETLSQHIKELYTNRDLRGRMGKKSGEIIKGYSYDVIVDNLLSISK